MDADMPRSDRRKYIIGGIALAIVAVAAFLLIQAPQAPSGQADQQEDAFQQYADADEETGTTDTQGATVVKRVNINEFGVTPSRVEINTGEAVGWVNKNSFPVRLEFDRTSQTPVLEPGGETSMRFRGITYYEVFNTENDKRIARGSIYVE